MCTRAPDVAHVEVLGAHAVAAPLAQGADGPHLHEVVDVPPAGTAGPERVDRRHGGDAGVADVGGAHRGPVVAEIVARSSPWRLRTTCTRLQYSSYAGRSQRPRPHE